MLIESEQLVNMWGAIDLLHSVKICIGRKDLLFDFT